MSSLEVGVEEGPSGNTHVAEYAEGKDHGGREIEVEAENVAKERDDKCEYYVEE